VLTTSQHLYLLMMLDVAVTQHAVCTVALPAGRYRADSSCAVISHTPPLYMQPVETRCQC